MYNCSFFFMHNFCPTFLDLTLPFVYNYKPANFKEDFISALTALVTAQDDPQRLKELSDGAKSILNNKTMGFHDSQVDDHYFLQIDYHKELPEVLKKVKLICFSYSLMYILNTFV